MPPQEQQQQQAPLVRLLQALDETTWDRVLLPRLRRDGSAANAALACKALRVLVCRTQQKLHLSRPPGSGLAHAAVALAPERFPACHTVALTIASMDNAIHHMPATVRALARLPSLSRLELEASVQDPNPGVIATAALGMAGLLQQLRSLQLQVSSPCAKDGHVLRALGGVSQLTWLKLDLQAPPSASQRGLDLRQLAALSGLLQLERLYVTAASIAPEPASCAYLSCLTRLTFLRIPTWGVDGLTALAGLTRLQYLCLSVCNMGAQRPSLDEAVCSALGQLASLTLLNLQACDGTASPAFLSALAGLQQLQVLAVDDSIPATLGVLAGMPWLTQLVGACWRPPPADGDDVLHVCPFVKLLSLAHVPLSLERSRLPWEAFPGLMSLMQREIWSPCEFVSITNSCKQLTGMYFSGSLRSLCECPRAQQMAAIRSLAQLAHLRRLEWSAADDCELGVLATLTQLHALMVFGRDNSRCTATGVGVTVAVRHLSSVSLDLKGLLQNRDCGECFEVALLSSSGHLAALSLHVSEQQQARFEGALTMCRDSSVPVPRVVKFGSFKSSW